MEATMTDRASRAAGLMGEDNATLEAQAKLVKRERERERASSYTGSMGLRRWIFVEPFLGSPTLSHTVAEPGFNTRIFDAIQSFYLSLNRPRDRQIAERITTLFRDAVADAEQILPASLAQFTAFFLTHAYLKLPKITLTPDGTLRARWINGVEDFVAIEFTGDRLVKLVAEVPREEGQTASYFATELVESAIKVGQAIGATFG
jgi:hypothetical protein